MPATQRWTRPLHAPFSKERRMKFAEPIKLNRKPGGTLLIRGASCRAKHRDGSTENLFLISHPPARRPTGTETALDALVTVFVDLERFDFRVEC
jgi:hypothetical protein